MADIPKKEPGEIKEPVPEKEPREIKEKAPEEVVEEIYVEKKEELEKRELLTAKEKIIREQLESEVAKMKLSPQLQDEAQQKAQQIKDLDKKGQIMRLFQIAEEKGLTFAVEVAKDMKDPYLLDIFHDLLAREGLYKKFEK